MMIPMISLLGGLLIGLGLAAVVAVVAVAINKGSRPASSESPPPQQSETDNSGQ